MTGGMTFLKDTTIMGEHLGGGVVLYEKAVKDAGLAKLQGKDYVVQDGDCIYFHFNV